MIVYVDGDSYTTPNFCVDSKDSYWQLFGNYLNARSITNYAYAGKSNTGMIRNAMRFVLDNPDSEVFVLLGFSHLERLDYFDINFSKGHQPDIKNPNPSERGVRSCPLYSSAQPDEIIKYDREFEESIFLSQLLSAYGFFKNKNIKFIFHFCSVPLLQDNLRPLINTFLIEIKQYKEIVNLFDNTYMTLNQKLGIKPSDFNQYSWMGHHGEQGNKAYADFLINKYKEIYEN